MYRALIADDAYPIRISLKKSVEYGADMLVSGLVKNGLDALQWLESYYADICITDIRMPKMDGLELLERIRANYPWMASIVVSGYDEFDYARKSMQLDAVDYILKPIEQPLVQQALLQAVRKLETRRKHEAVELLVSKLPHSRQVMEQWVEKVKTLKQDHFPLLLADTVELLGRWTEGRYYLLSPLCKVWLNSVWEELTKNYTLPKPEYRTHEEREDEALPQEEVRSYFRLGAVRTLEEGAKHLFKAMQEVRDEQIPRMIAEITAFIERHYTKKLDLESIARHVGISKNYMSSLFKQEMNTTVLNYIVDLRMKKARELLLQSHYKSYEIAHLVGYDKIDYFTKLFKKHYGLTPMDFKRRMDP